MAMKRITRKIKPPTVARITTTWFAEDDLAVVAPRGDSTSDGDGGAIWITVAGEGAGRRLAFGGHAGPDRPGGLGPVGWAPGAGWRGPA